LRSYSTFALCSGTTLIEIAVYHVSRFTFLLQSFADYWLQGVHVIYLFGLSLASECQTVLYLSRPQTL
jgi:hypothetical protein